MARATPRVEGATLVDRAGVPQSITVGTPAWYTWLEQATTFAFSGPAGRFTARKERRGRADGYWRAYRKCAGKVSSAYLGKSADLTLERLEDAAATLANSAATVNPTLASQGGVPAAATATTHMRTRLPAGTVTFLVTDLADTTRLPTQDPQGMSPALDRASTILHEAIAAAGGVVFRMSEHGLGAAFASPVDAVSAALHMQRLVHAEQWGSVDRFQPRIALHTGVVAQRDGGYIGQPMRYATLLLAATHRGQILLSHVTQELVRNHLPADTALHHLGSYALGEMNYPDHLFQLVATDLPATFPPLQAPARRPHNLPSATTPLIGREREVEAVVSALHRPEVRLLTLTGPGGVGKTRLGLEVAATLRDAFTDGVFFIDLATVHDPHLVLPTIARTLGVHGIHRQPLLAHLCGYVAAKQLLLLLDNFEQVLPAATVLPRILAAAPQIKLLVTSRAALHLTSEHEFPVASLALPPTARHASTAPNLWASELEAGVDVTQYAAVRLFIQRAQAVKPAFAVSEETAPIIAEICQRLDGLPLAIELAAARIKLFPPEVLFQRLDRRLPLLTGGPRDLPARQQTLRDTIAWSYHLLVRDVQALLQWLAVFEGSFTLDAAETVVGEHWSAISDPHGNPVNGSHIPAPAISVPDGLATLIDQSFLRPVERAAGGPRFMLLETIREYALEQLELTSAAPTLRQRHAAYYLRLAEQAEPELRGSEMRTWLDRLEAEHTNLRAALTSTFAQGAVDVTARIAAALGMFWDVRAHQREGRDWLAAVLARGEHLTPTVRAKTLLTAGWLARASNDQAMSIELLEQSLALYRQLADERGIAAAATVLGWSITWFGGDIQRAATLLEDGLARYRRLGDAPGIASALHGLGWLELHQRGNLAAAQNLHAESLALRRQVGYRRGIAWSLTSLAQIAFAQGAYAAARAFQEERLDIERSLDNRHGIAAALHGSGVIAFRQADAPAARTFLAESLALARKIDDKRVIADSLSTLGEMAQAEGDAAQARALLEEALSFLRELGNERDLARTSALLAEIAHDSQDTATARAVEHSARTPRPAGLTEREYEVFLLLAQGLSNAEIAARLVLSISTVKTYLNNIYRKLNVSSRTAAMRYAIDHHLG